MLQRLSAIAGFALLVSVDGRLQQRHGRVLQQTITGIFTPSPVLTSNFDINVYAKNIAPAPAMAAVPPPPLTATQIQNELTLANQVLAAAEQASSEEWQAHQINTDSTANRLQKLGAIPVEDPNEELSAVYTQMNAVESTESNWDKTRGKLAQTFDAGNARNFDTQLAAGAGGVNTTAQQQALEAHQQQEFKTFVMGQEAVQQNVTGQYFAKKAATLFDVSSEQINAFDAAQKTKANGIAATSSETLIALEAPSMPPPQSWAQFQATHAEGPTRAEGLIGRNVVSTYNGLEDKSTRGGFLASILLLSFSACLGCIFFAKFCTCDPTMLGKNLDNCGSRVQQIVQNPNDLYSSYNFYAKL